MNITKKCESTQRYKLSISKNRRHPSAGTFYTSSAGAVISLILMRKDRLFIINKLLVTSPIVASILIALLFLSLSLFTGATNLFGLNGSAYADYTISMTSSGAQSINVSPGASGVGTSISVDAVTVTTTCPAGYNLTTTTSVNDNKLYLNGSSSNNASGTYFNPSDGTTALSNAANTWGFYQNGSTVPTASSVFKPVPISTSTPATIRTSSSTSDSFNIYYGVAVGNDLTPGTYKMIPEQNTNENGTIVYYLTMAEECIETKQYMQDVTESDLAELMPNVGDSATLYDKRDEQPYTIAKLADNKYWTLDNLRLDLTNSTTINSLTATNTNADSTSLTSLKTGNRSAGAQYASAGFSIWNSSNPGSPANQAKANVDYKDTTTTSYGEGSGKIGVYYNYCAASAGSYCYDSGAGTGDTQYDLCPAGWRIPTGGNSGEFQSLYLAYSSDATRFRNAYSATFSGSFYDGSAGNQGTYGIFWSPTYYDTNNMYTLRVDSETIVPTRTNNRNRGYSIRCVKKKDTSASTLYDLVAAQSKGTQTLSELRAAITTSNSGVYEYNSSVFGTASDATNTSKIYYYRGILDNTTGTYGSDGDNVAWPNTVLLDTTGNGKDTSDTCWRIVRTTGSGGVKIIYQGKWTGSTCANAQANAQVTTQAFGLKGNSSQSTYWYRNINRVGYTFNNDASIQDITTATSVDTVFGSNSSPSTNNARSNIKTYIEDTWYPGAIGASSGHNFTSKLEASAGYCNDRTAFTNESGTSSMSTIPPYATSGADTYFGSYTRIANATSASTNRPSLTCPRSTVDLYRYVANSTGVSNQLKYPAALLTADEAAFAGSGWSSSTTPYHANSFLRSGSSFWLLSPGNRDSFGYASSFYLYSSGRLYSIDVSHTYGVRPAISLKPGSMAVSGSGTAADPWIVNPDQSAQTMQTVTSSDLATLIPSEGDVVTLEDERDGNNYKITKISNNYWMAENLRITNTTGQSIGTILADGSNFNNDITFDGDLTSGNSYVAKRYHVPNETDLSTLGLTSNQIGIWYNYCAASAGTVCNSTDEVDATQDICPAGWKMPSSTELESVIGSVSIFSPYLSGYYSTGALADSHYGYWWSSEYNSATAQKSFRYTGSALSVRSTNKRLGLTIRCIKKQ